MYKRSNYYYTSKSYSFSTQRQSSFIRDTKGFPLEQDRATSSKGVDDLSGSKGLHRGAQGSGYSSDLERSKCASGGTESDKTPCLFLSSVSLPPSNVPAYKDGLFTRLRLLEGLIHELALKADFQGLRKALKEYSEAWIELERGILCKK